MKKKTVLFVPSYDGHIRTFHRIVERLRDTDLWDPFVVFLEGIHGYQLASYSEKYHLPLIHLRFPHPTSPIAGGMMTRMNNAWRFYAYLRNVQKVVEQFFDDKAPAFLFSATEGFTDTHFLFEARKRRIPSLCLCSYLVSLSLITERFQARKPGPMQILYNSGLSFIGLPACASPVGYADMMALWGKHHYESFVERGVSPAQLAVVGSPAHDLIFDRLQGRTPGTASEIKVGFGIHPDRRVFLFCTQPVAVDGLCTPEEQRSLTERVIKACNRFHDYVLIVKLHPRESAQQYAWLLRYPNSACVYLFTETDADLYDLLHISDIMITQSSSTGLDALLFGRDMVIIDVLMRVKDAMGYVATGAALNVNDTDALVDTLTGLIENEETKKALARQRQKFIASCIDHFDGQATERVLGLMERMLRERRQS